MTSSEIEAEELCGGEMMQRVDEMQQMKQMKDIWYSGSIFVCPYHRIIVLSYHCIVGWPYRRISRISPTSIRALVLLRTSSQGRRLFLATPHPTTASRVQLRNTPYQLSTEHVLLKMDQESRTTSPPARYSSCYFTIDYYSVRYGVLYRTYTVRGAV